MNTEFIRGLLEKAISDWYKTQSKHELITKEESDESSGTSRSSESWHTPNLCGTEFNEQLISENIEGTVKKPIIIQNIGASSSRLEKCCDDSEERFSAPEENNQSQNTKSGYNYDILKTK